MNRHRSEIFRRDGDLLRTLTRALLLTAGLVVLLWFLYQTLRVLLLFILALILALAINAPVTWLERKGLGRALAALVVFTGLAALLGALGWFVLPRLIEQVPTLLDELPNLVEGLAERLAGVLGDHPEIERQLSQVVDWVLEAISGAWQHAGAVAGAVVLSLFVVALVLYMVIDPRPLLRGYIAAMPAHQRPAAARAFARAAEMVVGWVASNVILGGIKATASFLFLTYMQVPGAILWSVLALFAALIPRLGFYLMAFPPVVVALSVDPLTALWVGLFYVVLSEILGNFVAPRVQAETMDLHPAYLLLMTLAMAVAFGVVGVLVASPVAGFLKVYFDEFYLARQPEDARMEERVEAMMDRDAERAAGEEEPPPRERARRESS
ncbi:MAG: AI-2E family transporter [Longimicrobiaceae bacterium]